jgi:hypothetical protein
MGRDNVEQFTNFVVAILLAPRQGERVHPNLRFRATLGDADVIGSPRS